MMFSVMSVYKALCLCGFKKNFNIVLRLRRTMANAFLKSDVGIKCVKQRGMNL